MARLKEQYKAEVAPALYKKFGYKSTMQIPKIDKVVVNVGCGEAKENAKVLEAVVRDAGALVALGAHDLHLGSVHGSLTLHNAAGLALLAGLDVAGHHVDALHDDLGFAGDGAEHLALLALVLTGQDDNGIALLHIHSHSSSPP